MDLSKAAVTVSTPSILERRRLPALLNCEQTAEFLGVSVAHISQLVRARLLTPLGQPRCNAPKVFGSTELETLSKDRSWLDRAMRAIYRYNRERNQRYAAFKNSVRSTRAPTVIRRIVPPSSDDDPSHSATSTELRTT
jgi:hypothetical protein